MSTLGILDPSKWTDFGKSVPVKSADQYRAELEEQRAHDREVRALIDEALDTRAAKHLRGEREQREAEISKCVDELFAENLAAAIEKRLPSERVRQKHIETFREFQTFCREYGLGSLPATGPVLFFWLVHDNAPQEVARRTRALRFVFDISREYFDERYIAAAERWARNVKPKTEKENESGKDS